MGKVVTSAGVEEFVRTGKHEVIANHKAHGTEAPKLETVKAAPDIQVSAPGEKTEAKPAAVAESKLEEHDEALTAEEQQLDEKAQKELKRAKRAVSKKHKEMMEAKEAAEDAERFAQTQFDERRLLQQRLEQAESRLQAGQQPVQTPVEAKKPTVDDKKPDGSWMYRDDAGNVNWDLYTDAKADFAADQKMREREAKEAKAQADAQEAETRARILQNTEATRALHPDFDQVMERIKGSAADSVPNFVLNYLHESDNAAGVAYYLATHREESQEIAKMRPILGIKALGKIEDQLIDVKPSKVTETTVTQGATKAGAPPPITPISTNGSGVIQTDPSKMSYKELRAYEKAREKAKRS